MSERTIGPGAGQPSVSRYAFPLAVPRFRTIVSPDVPAQARRVFAEERAWQVGPGGEPLGPGTVLAVVPGTSAMAGVSVGGFVGLLASLGDVVSRVPLAEHNVYVGALVGGALGLLTGIPISWGLVRRWRTWHTALQWSRYVITGARQRAGALADPELGARLVTLTNLIDRIRRSRAFRDGWLPGIDEESLTRVHYTLANGLLDTVDLRRAVAEAGNRAVFAAQVAARRQELAEADATFDAQLEELRSIISTADSIEQRLDELALAERLGAHAINPAQLRRQFAASDTADLPAMAEAARAAATMVRAALDPTRLFQA